MIDRELLESLVKLLDESSLDSLEIERGRTRIRLAKSPQGGPATVVAPAQALPFAGGLSQAAVAGAPSRPAASSDAASAAAPSAPADQPAGAAGAPEDADPVAATLTEVTSPMVGTFYRAPSPEADPYVKTGDSVEEGDVLCVIEAMKLMNELECETPGRIVEVCAGNAEPVDYGQVLFRIEPA